MIKKLLLIALLALPMGIFAQNLKFGHLRSSEIIPLMAEYTKAQTDLQGYFKNYQDELKKLEDEFNKKVTEFQNEEKTLPENIKNRRQQELQDMATRAQEFQTTSEQDMQKKQQELMAPILQKANDAITAVGQEQGFTYIFDLDSTPIPYVNETTSTDVTAAVKAKLGITQ